MSSLYTHIKYLSYFTLFVLFFQAMTPVSGIIIISDGTEVARSEISDLPPSAVSLNNPAPWKFFYDNGCQSCDQAREYLKSFAKKNPQIPITQYNLAYPEENRGLFTWEKSRFNTTKIRYPALFAGDVVLSGSSDIIHGTQPLAIVSGYDRTQLPA